MSTKFLIKSPLDPVKFLVWKNGQVWNGSTFVDYAAVDLATYYVSATRQGSSDRYVATFPAGIVTEGLYEVEAVQQVGGSPSETNDLTVMVGNVSWDGAAIIGANGVTLKDGAITDAKITTPSEAAGRPSTILAMIRRLFERSGNKRTRNRSTGVVTVFGDDDTTPLETSTQSTTGSVDQQTKSS